MDTVDQPMLDASSRLRAAMLANYGEEFRRKWQGFTPRELGLMWSRKFSTAKIHPSVIDRLCDTLQWTRTPNLPEIVEALEALQEDMKREQNEAQIVARLPAPSQVADPASKAVQDFKAEMKRFMRGHLVR